MIYLRSDSTWANEDEKVAHKSLKNSSRATKMLVMH